MSALADFRSSLNQIRALADDIGSQAANALADPDLRARHQTVQCSCVVLLIGFFESFIRQFAEEAVTSLCALNAPFGSLDGKIRKTHFEEGGRILQAKASGNRRHAWIAASQEDIARRLHSVARPTGYEIVWEAFANTNANPGIEVVRTFLANFGIKDGWRQIAAKNGVSKAWAMESLDNIIVVRNECAHTGSVAIVPLPSDLRAYSDNLERLAGAMESLVLAHIATLAQPAGSATAGTGAPAPAARDAIAPTQVARGPGH